MSKARIYRLAKTATQSGKARTKEWWLEFEPTEPLRHDPLTGWVGGGSTLERQVRLRFPSLEAATAYAERHGIAYEVEPAADYTVKPKSYADNFAYTRRENWTH